MENPILIEVLRGAVVESCHRGTVSVVDGDGRPVLTIGDVTRPVFPRSAIKAIQALPLVESGAADAYMLGNRELALACASHSGEEGHVETARTMLARAGITEASYECGAHWPFYQSNLIDLFKMRKIIQVCQGELCWLFNRDRILQMKARYCAIDQRPIQFG